MDGQSSFQPLRPSSEGPHPLRPYYRPPSIGHPPDTLHNSTGARTSSGSGIFSGFNYGDVVGDAASGFGSGISLKGLLDDALWKYTSVFMAQPFEVAKIVLQVRLNEVSDEKDTHNPSRGSSRRQQDQAYISDSSDSDNPSYFTSTHPSQPTYHQSSARRRHRSRHRSSLSVSSPNAQQPKHPPHRISLKKPDSLTEVLSQLYANEGAWGIWKGTNATFLYSLLHRTLESFARSTLAAILNLPDPAPASSLATPSSLDIIDSPSPLFSLSITIAAAALSGALLAPLDIVRTRLMLTPTTSTKRSILPCLRDLTSWACPTAILPTTLIHSTLPSLFSTLTPLGLRNVAGIDPVITPAAYSTCTFLASAAELFVRLSVETVLRRGQMQVVLQDHAAQTTDKAVARSASRGRSGGRSGRRQPQESLYPPSTSNPPDEKESPLDTIIPIGPFTTLPGTMWRIARDEGERIETPVSGALTSQRQTDRRRKRGQGVQGLWRGWRVGWWGLVGVWGAGILGRMGGEGGEF
ncbi:MAG: hypothetical protein Q9162_000418 [Coniocarpon cinnabarinum]